MTAEEKAAFKALQNTVQKQADRIKTLERAAKQPKVPAWAEQACINAKAVGALDTANDGSFDFYRMSRCSTELEYSKGEVSHNDRLET